MKKSSCPIYAIKSASALTLCLVAASPSPVYSQSFRQDLESEEQEERAYILSRKESIVAPLKQAEKCYTVVGDSIEDSVWKRFSFSPYICKKKNSADLFVMYGTTTPAAYYYYDKKSVSRVSNVVGSFYGERGFQFDITWNPAVIGQVVRNTYSASLSVVNPGVFYIRWNYRSWTDRWESRLYECHFNNMTCYTREGSTAELKQVSFVNIIENLTR